MQVLFTFLEGAVTDLSHAEQPGKVARLSLLPCFVHDALGQYLHKVYNKKYIKISKPFDTATKFGCKLALYLIL